MNPKIKKLLKIKIQPSRISLKDQRVISSNVKKVTKGRNTLFHDILLIFKIGLLKISITPAPNAGLDPTFSRFCLML